MGNYARVLRAFIGIVVVQGILLSEAFHRRLGLEA